MLRSAGNASGSNPLDNETLLKCIKSRLILLEYFFKQLSEKDLRFLLVLTGRQFFLMLIFQSLLDHVSKALR
jgi:2-hydroxy-3-keto-5-methylthiopentenyl-1-phosphate phosphatase